ncbi:DNA methyltransferase [Campylobacter cuniculorum]|uniref:DNA methyltransferase (HsdR N-terminal domain) n=2 Tax=Campylobacter cuniculorum TaxID=374106 RepID=A0A1W6BVC2_9BACT|nr:DNA methyltransferase [Campylobacter cuniculorum]ARJ56028.1 DNA methyltransferase (HsdR N-terminal domain) [Campylobacter cuniculorum DSM 23162 = LMG 24588]QOR05248.1 type I restriction enzyme HsdR N-terminal domain-containing protein [Campylobacter cuniculorum]
MITFDFTQFKNADFVSNFKEDSVRKFIIDPLLDKIGFVLKDDKNPKKLEMKLSEEREADIRIGSNKNIKTRLIPDYTLYVDSKLHCILDAKAAKINIEKGSEAFKQALSYATNFNAHYFALCNGLKFNLFSILGQEVLLELDFMSVEDGQEALLKQYLSTPPHSLRQDIHSKVQRVKKPDSWYLERPLPQAILKPQKQAKARYFGCTAYFTRQSWDIVTQNIKNFTDEGDVVLDPFGGSGVSAIEAMMNGRIGIHTDLNPLSIFMVKALSAKVDCGVLYDLSEEILAEFESLKPQNEKEAKSLLKSAKYYPNTLSEEFGETASQKEQDASLWIPQDELLPKGSDVDSVLGLFTPLQLAELALLRKLIFKHTTPSGNKELRITKRNLRYSLMLAFYNTITLINLTYHNTDRGGPASAITRYYRYRIAPKPDFLDTAKTFRAKIQRVLKGKRELENSPVFYSTYFHPTTRVIKDFKHQLLKARLDEDLSKIDSLLDKTNGEKIFQADATKLKEIEKESIDFIYTDPPYGAKIPYLDLSTMWNAWLDLPVSKEVREKECIEKGSLEKTREEYYDLMKASLKEMYRVLKFNRWLAFVFQHQDPKLWQIIKNSAEEVGFEYVQSIRQSNGQTSFKKRQYSFSVLSGQLIMYFKKVDNPKTRAKQDLGDNFDIIIECARDEIIKNDGATFDEIHDAIMIKAMDEGFLDELSENFSQIMPFVEQRLDFDEKTKKYHIGEFDPHKHMSIPLEVRAHYFITSYCNRCKKEGRPALFDDICLEVIPKLSNGVSPSNDDIRNILDKIAVIVDKKTGEYRLKNKRDKEPSLFEDF